MPSMLTCPSPLPALSSMSVYQAVKFAASATFPFMGKLIALSVESMSPDQPSNDESSSASASSAMAVPAGTRPL